MGNCNKKNVEIPPLYEEIKNIPLIDENSVGYFREQSIEKWFDKIRNLVQNNLTRESVKEHLQREPFSKRVLIFTKNTLPLELVDIWNDSPNLPKLEIVVWDKLRKDGTPYTYKSLYVILDDKHILEL